MVLRSIGVLSCGKILGIMYALLGLLVGGVFALMAAAGAVMPQPPQANNANPAVMFAGVGIAAVVLFPIFYGVMGFVGGIIAAAIYNLVAGLVGGLELDIEQAPHSRPLA